MDSDCCVSNPAAVYTPALNTKNDFGSAGITTPRNPL
jgi:hypothetical protein